LRKGRRERGRFVSEREKEACQKREKEGAIRERSSQKGGRLRKRLIEGWEHLIISFGEKRQRGGETHNPGGSRILYRECSIKRKKDQ